MLRKPYGMRLWAAVPVALLVILCATLASASAGDMNPNRDDFVPEGALPALPTEMDMIFDDHVPLIPLEQLPDTGAGGSYSLPGLLVPGAGVVVVRGLLMHRMHRMDR